MSKIVSKFVTNHCRSRDKGQETIKWDLRWHAIKMLSLIDPGFWKAKRSQITRIEYRLINSGKGGCHITFTNFHMQDKFYEKPAVFVTAEHQRTGKEYDASHVWTEDITKNSFKVCLREMQNFDGKHEDIHVVWTLLYWRDEKRVKCTVELYEDAKSF